MAAAAKRPTFTPPKSYNFKQLELLWMGAGGSKIAAPVAAAIALAESGGNPNSENHNTNGSIDRGLWQINSVHGSLSTTGIVANAKAAVKVFDEAGKNFAPWVTFKTGAYKKFIGQSVDIEKGEPAQGIVEHPLKDLGHLLSGQTAEEAGEKVGGAVKKATTGWVAEITSFIGKEAVTFGLLLLGLALMVYGIIVAVRPAGGAGLSLPRPPIPVPVP